VFSPAVLAFFADGKDLEDLGSKRSHLEQNVKAASIRLTAEDLAELDALPSPVGSGY